MFTPTSSVPFLGHINLEHRSPQQGKAQSFPLSQELHPKCLESSSGGCTLTDSSRPWRFCECANRHCREAGQEYASGKTSRRLRLVLWWDDLDHTSQTSTNRSIHKTPCKKQPIQKLIPKGSRLKSNHPSGAWTVYRSVNFSHLDTLQKVQFIVLLIWEFGGDSLSLLAVWFWQLMRAGDIGRGWWVARGRATYIRGAPCQILTRRRQIAIQRQNMLKYYGLFTRASKTRLKT